MTECDKCEQEIPESNTDIIDCILMLIMDDFTYGYRCQCAECGNRLDPTEQVTFFDDHGRVSEEDVGTMMGESMLSKMQEDTEDVNFLEMGTLEYGKLD